MDQPYISRGCQTSMWGTHVYTKPSTLGELGIQLPPNCVIVESFSCLVLWAAGDMGYWPERLDVGYVSL